ncbi:amino acid transporter-like protein [Hyaloscypha bicolor E]|uniref:Amino acid transporter-like protein n=1 Tax=Hyaloscypha bicolor E TaxID=1095630 RepID=A0A2J6TG13_9HELO|nr:amino acid transporter-like protein [Hyaloscypha bicolor E]PMD61953.1 amino acid transporter-like protein [Hyaloscypha bicolor E]
MTTATTLEGNDPRDPTHAAFGDNEPVEKQLAHNIHDRSVSFEEYVYYATITRADEKIANERFVAAAGPKSFKSVIKSRFSKGHKESTALDSPTADNNSNGEKTAYDENGIIPARRNLGGITDSEWKNASRAIRTAGWSSVFYLITTDILGPFSVPWAFAQMGCGPGVALYTVFGGFAMYFGFQLWKVFMALDSDRYPMKSYADCFFRVYGRWARHGVNILQAIQLLFTVSILILSNGQAISQVSKASICFIVCLVIFMAAGMVVGQIRTLQRFGWLANFAVWINLLILFIAMGVAANSPPNYATAEASFGPNFGPGPVHTYAGTPPDGMASGGSGFVGSLNGLNQAVYSYGGAMLFISFLAEMRHPWDFWKGILCADIFIYVVYLFFGVFVYSYQGQYAFNPVMQGLSPYNWQTATNIMNIVTGLIAACLYGNIGIKVAYVEVFQELLHAPPLTTKTGKFLWVALVPAYWALAWVVCAAIPQFSYISGLVGAVCILQFTYTFPAILAFGFQIQKDAMVPEESFDPATRTYNRIDTGVKRWVRGFKVKWHLNAFNFF